jgi:pyruvate/2-oxoglutarate dehydrogenase complex dihydrolipoamide dehydrogenase (E3) component
MSARHFDAIVVGAGQAGPSMAGRLTAAGKSVAMIERKLFGGTCVNTGCTPTKTLVATDGFMKVLVDAESKEILGASFLGTSGDEAIHCVLDTMYAKAPSRNRVPAPRQLDCPPAARHGRL